MPSKLRGTSLWTLTTLLFLWNYFLVYMMMDYYNFNDFGKLYHSAQAFLQGREMYGENAATFIKVTQDLSLQFWNLNPPHLHLILLPLALAPLPWALALWGGLSLAGLYYSLRLVRLEPDIRVLLGVEILLPCALAFVGTQTVCVTGQLSFLLLVPLTLFWRAARRDAWTRAGAWLGLAVSLKPFLLIFGPYLLLRRKFAGIFACAGACAGMFAAGLLIFGPAEHLAWLAALSKVDWAWASMNASLLGFFSRVLGPSPYFAPFLDASWLIRPLWLASCLALYAATLAATWPRLGQDTDRDLGLILLAALLISPLGWTYYLWLPLGPACALAWREQNRLSTGNARLCKFGLAGLMLPLPVGMLLGRTAISSLTLGSLYFWSCLVLWLALVRDSRARR